MFRGCLVFRVTGVGVVEMLVGVVLDNLGIEVLEGVCRAVFDMVEDDN